ncbi:hypothetical protein [Nocardioides plantarum]|uniref:Zinc ribbon domain-containing protein n=1 Tax=Nocardioides plantarum TaxID=29299 RepID=A0ABV5KAE8_9ACTN|nr:hypothetical protein [Nocardioides plantarum]
MTDSPTVPPVPPVPLSAVCPSCGAQTAYSPGTTVLRCGSCGAEQQIDAEHLTIKEHSYDEWQAKHGQSQVAALTAAVELKCRNCGAQTESTDVAGACGFCGGALVATQAPEGVVQPEAVVPFKVDRNAARAHFQEWVGSRRFAPNSLKKVGSTEGLKGTYIPHWTFDAQTGTDYEGKRGDYYYVTRTRTVSDGKGGTRTETYQQRHTRWSDRSGHVSRAFDDVLIVASHHVEREKLEKMGPWQLTEARPYQDEYVTGYSALRYDVTPAAGAEEARSVMREVIQEDVEHDIGGDEQRVNDMDVTYAQAMFKLVLMPLWIASYVHAGKTFQVLVNANTGKVVGDRPYSPIKIALAVTAALVVIGAIVAIVLLNRS